MVRFVWRDVNAALNILEVVQPKTKVETLKETVAENPVQLSLFDVVAGGQSETLNKTRSRRNPPPSPPGRGARGVGVVDGNESSTHPESIQLRLF